MSSANINLEEFKKCYMLLIKMRNNIGAKWDSWGLPKKRLLEKTKTLYKLLFDVYYTYIYLSFFIGIQ